MSNIGMTSYREAMSNETIALSSLMRTFLIKLETVKNLLAFLFSWKFWECLLCIYSDYIIGSH